MSKIIANYQLQKILGEGGMGKVYLGVNMQTGQKVAIKELNTNIAANQEIRKRFQREAEVLAMLNHPNIVKFQDFKHQDGFFYLMMEYAEGQTLASYIANTTGPIPESKAIAMMCSITHAFQYAHNKGIIHRDIKPNNIVIAPSGQIKILDFGIAKMVNKKFTTVGTVLGTPMYMSPEQVKGEQAAGPLDSRSDIYALGVLLFQMITGKPPYNESFLSEFELQKQVLTRPLPRAQDFYPGVTDHVQKVIDKATQKDKNQRYQTCLEFQNALINKEPCNPPTPQPQGISSISIGRDQSCNLVVQDNTGSVSRRHAEMRVVNGQYVYRDISTNGTLINGRQVLKTELNVRPGDSILLAGKVPLLWDRITAILPLKREAPQPLVNDPGKTILDEPVVTPEEPVVPDPPQSDPPGYYPPPGPPTRPVQNEEKLDVGIGILCFLFPIVGIILYFVWKDDYPRKAKSAGKLALINIGIGIGIFILMIIIVAVSV